MKNFLCGLSGFISIAYISLLARFGLWAYGTTTHSLSFEDAVYPVKYIGVFRKRRKVKTSFRRT